MGRPTPTAAPADARGAQVGVRRVWRRFARNPGAVFGLAVFLGIVAMAVLAPLLAPYDPLAQGVGKPLEGPTFAHWAGTDSFGRDIMSRIIYGARVALVVGLVAVALAMVIGVTLGLISGYYGGIVDTVIMRIMDGVMAFPDILLAISLMAALGPSLRNVVIALAFVYTPRVARVVRASVLVVVNLDYVDAARAIGARSQRILARHAMGCADFARLVQPKVAEFCSHA